MVAPKKARLKEANAELAVAMKVRTCTCVHTCMYSTCVDYTVYMHTLPCQHHKHDIACFVVRLHCKLSLVHNRTQDVVLHCLALHATNVTTQDRN